jgi:hypothetical protein
MREILKLRKKSSDDRQEEEAVLATYLHALGMLNDPVMPDMDEAPAHPMAAE